jgi:hypothetical protein
MQGSVLVYIYIYTHTHALSHTQSKNMILVYYLGNLAILLFKC